MELKGRAFPYLSCSHQIKAEKRHPPVPGCQQKHLKIGSFAKRTNASSLGRSLNGLLSGAEILAVKLDFLGLPLTIFNQAGAWSREVDWERF